MNHRLILGCFLSGILVTVACFSSGAQDSSREDDGGGTHSVRWVSQYPAARLKKDEKEKQDGTTGNLPGEESGKRKSRKKSSWFTDLVLGKKPDELVKPMAVVAVSPDKFWIADQGSGSILQVTGGVGEMTQFGRKDAVNLPSIVCSCLLPDGKILFTDSKLNKIFRFTPGEKELVVLNDSVLLDQPTGIAFSAVNEQVWVVETRAHRLTVLDREGRFIRQMGSRGISPGQFNYPTHLWIDKKGLIYVVDAMNFRIQIFDSSGAFVSAFGELGDSSGFLSRPKGIATDSYGHIYVADALFHAVQVFDDTGRLLYAFGSQGEEKEQFWMPTGIYIDENNFIYIADSYNSRVQVFQLEF